MDRLHDVSSPVPPEPSPPREVLDQVQARLGALMAAGDRDPGAHAGLRALLDTVAPPQRTPRWRETSVLTDGWFRLRAGATFQQLERMRERSRERGTTARFDAFYTEFVAAIRPYTIGDHGYQLALESRDETAVWRDVAAIQERLSGLGFASFVNSGTLLGLVRDGALIGYDDDVDLAVVLPGDTLADVVAAWVDLRRRLTEVGLMDAEFEAKQLSHTKIGTAGGASVDLFPAWVSQERAFVWPHTFGDVAAGDLLPLAPVTVSGVTVLAPRRPETLLASNYGQDWRTPEPIWEFDWARARERFADFISLMATAWAGPGAAS